MIFNIAGDGKIPVSIGDDRGQDSTTSGLTAKVDTGSLQLPEADDTNTASGSTSSLLSTSGRYSDSDIAECLDYIDDIICPDDPELDPNDDDIDEILRDLEQLVEQNQLSEDDNDTLSELILLFPDGETTIKPEQNKVGSLTPITEEEVVDMGQMLGLTTPDPPQPVQEDCPTEKDLACDFNRSENSLVGQQRYNEEDITDSSAESGSERDFAASPLTGGHEAITDEEGPEVETTGLNMRLPENLQQETNGENEATETGINVSSTRLSISRDGSFISCSNSVEDNSSNLEENKDGGHNKDEITNDSDDEENDNVFEDIDDTNGEERQPLLENSVSETTSGRPLLTPETLTAESLDEICIEMVPASSMPIMEENTTHPLSNHIPNGIQPEGDNQQTKPSKNKATITFPMDSVAIMEDFFLKYADILDNYLSEAVDRFESHILQNHEAIFDLLQRYHELPPCHSPKDDTALDDYVAAILNEDLLPSLADFKDALMIDAPECRSKSRPQIIISVTAFRKIRQNFNTNILVELIRNTILDALKATKPTNVESVVSMVIQNLDIRFSQPDTGHELLCCVWRQTVNVFNFCRVSPLPRNAYTQDNVRPLDIVVQEMKKDLVLQVRSLLSLDDNTEQIVEVLKKPSFTASPAMFVLKHLQPVVEFTLDDCRIQYEEALLVSIEKLACDDTTDLQIQLGRLLQDLLLRVDSSLVVQASGLLPHFPITAKNLTTALEIAIKAAPQHEEGHQRSFSDMIIEHTESETLNTPLQCNLSEVFGFKEGIMPLVLAAVISGSDMMRKLQEQGARLDSADRNGNFFHNLVQFYHQLGNEACNKRWRDRLLDAHQYTWEAEGVVSCKQLLQTRSLQKLTPLELAIQLDCVPFYEAICNKLSIESSTGGHWPLTMYDVTDLDRGAFGVAATSPSGVNSAKSVRSYFALDLAVLTNKLKPNIINNCLMHSLIQCRVENYKNHYYMCGVVHFVFMVLMTLCAVYRPVKNSSFSEMFVTPGDKARFFADICVLIYAMLLIGAEIYDVCRFCNVCCFIKSLPRCVKNLFSGSQSLHMAVVNMRINLQEAFHLLSLFRGLLFVFAWAAFFTFTFRLSSVSGEAFVLCVGLISGWLLLVFFLVQCHFAVALISIGKCILSYALVYSLILTGFTSALFVSLQTAEEAPSYADTVYFWFRLAVPSDDFNSIALSHSSLSVLIYCLSLFVTTAVLISFLIAMTVNAYRDICGSFDALSLKLMAGILLLIERRLPTSSRRVNFLIKNGRAYFLVHAVPQTEDPCGHGDSGEGVEYRRDNESHHAMEEIVTAGSYPLLSRRQSRAVPATASPPMIPAYEDTVDMVDSPIFSPMMGSSSPLHDVPQNDPAYGEVLEPNMLGSGELSHVEDRVASERSLDRDSVVNV